MRQEHIPSGQPEQIPLNFEGGNTKEKVTQNELTPEEKIQKEVERLKSDSSGRYTLAPKETLRNLAKMNIRYRESGKSSVSYKDHFED